MQYKNSVKQMWRVKNYELKSIFQLVKEIRILGTKVCFEFVLKFSRRLCLSWRIYSCYPSGIQKSSYGKLCANPWKSAVCTCMFTQRAQNSSLAAVMLKNGSIMEIPNAEIYGTKLNLLTCCRV